MVECCFLKTPFRNFFLFINLSDRIKFTQYLELAKQDLGGGRAGDRQCLCVGATGRPDHSSSLRPAKPHSMMFPASLFPFGNELKWGERHGCRPVASVRDGDTVCDAAMWLQSRASWQCQGELVLCLPGSKRESLRALCTLSLPEAVTGC